MRLTLPLVVLGVVSVSSCEISGYLGNAINPLICCTNSDKTIDCDVHSSYCWSDPDGGLRNSNGNCPDRRDDVDRIRSAPASLCADGCDSCPPGHAAEEAFLMKYYNYGADTGWWGATRIETYCIECAPGTYKTGGSRFSVENKGKEEYSLNQINSERKSYWFRYGLCSGCPPGWDRSLLGSATNPKFTGATSVCDCAKKTGDSTWVRYPGEGCPNFPGGGAQVADNSPALPPQSISAGKGSSDGARSSVSAAGTWAAALAAVATALARQ